MHLAQQQQDPKVTLDTSLKDLQKIFCFTLVLYLSLTTFGCSGTNISASKEEIPAKAFSLNDISIETRNGKEIEWQGTGAHAGGDLDTAQIDNLVMNRRDKQSDEILFTLKAPKADIDFKSNTLKLSKTLVSDQEGAQVRGAESTYNAKLGEIDIQGPIFFEANQLTMQAASASMDLIQGQIKAQGPIVGKVQVKE